MGMLDQFIKNKEKGQEQEHITPPPKGHTVSEILQDKSKFHLFTRLLEKDGQEELGRRLMEGKPEADDLRLLSEYRVKFSEKIAQSEKIEKLLTEENVIDIARKHPDFAKIIDIATPKQVIKVIQGQLREICFADEDRFNTISKPIETHDRYKNGGYKETEDKVEKYCKENGISTREYLEALTIEDPREKEKALKKLAKGQHDNFRTAWNMVSGKNRRVLAGMKESEADFEDSVRILNTLKNDIGKILYSSVSGNGKDDIRHALGREIIAESTPAAEESKPGFADMKKEAAGIFKEQEFDKEWEREKKAKNYDRADEPQKEAIKKSFIERAQKHHREKSKSKGFWASIFASMIEGKINDKGDNLK